MIDNSLLQNLLISLILKYRQQYLIYSTFLLMINKGAESLPARDAQAYKQLAVIRSIFRNSTTLRTIKKD